MISYKISNKIYLQKSFYKGFLLVFLLITACKKPLFLGEDYIEPKIETSESWQNNSLNIQENSTNKAINKKWWEDFQDSQLNQIIELALKDNHGLNIARSRILESRANVKFKKSELMPKVDATATASRSNNNFNPINPNNHPVFNFFRTGFDASWELDFFGGNYSQKKASEFLFFANQEQEKLATKSLIAEIAKNYLELRFLQNELIVNQSLKDIYQENLDLNKAKNRSGFVDEITLKNLENDILDSESQIVDLEAQIQSKIYNIEVLAGQKIGHLAQDLKQFKSMPKIDNNIFVDLPAEIIANRPDVNIASHEFMATIANKNFAVSQIFPKISIAAFFGFLNTETGNLLKPNSQVFSTSAGVNLPILHFGKLKAGIKIADAQKEQALIKFEETINKAIFDIESAFLNYNNKCKQKDIANDLLQNNHNIVEFQQKKYNAGLISYLGLNESKIQDLQSLLSFLQKELDENLAMISVLKSLAI